MKNEELTYDVIFNDDSNSNSVGIHGSIDDCMSWIDSHDGDLSTYFGDYSGGSVSIVSDNTSEVIMEFPISTSGCVMYG